MDAAKAGAVSVRPAPTAPARRRRGGAAGRTISRKMVIVGTIIMLEIWKRVKSASPGRPARARAAPAHLDRTAAPARLLRIARDRRRAARGVSDGGAGRADVEASSYRTPHRREAPVLGGIDVSMYSRAVLRGGILQGTERMCPKRVSTLADARDPPHQPEPLPPALHASTQCPMMRCILPTAGGRAARAASANFEDIEKRSIYPRRRGEREREGWGWRPGERTPVCM